MDNIIITKGLESTKMIRIHVLLPIKKAAINANKK